MLRSSLRSRRLILILLSLMVVVLVTSGVLAGGSRSYLPSRVIGGPGGGGCSGAACPPVDSYIPFNPNDDRLNQRDLDKGASVAVYCRSGDFHIYRINDQSQGQLALVVTKAQIDAVGVPTGANALIASVDVPLGQIQVWRLTTGEFQLMAAPVRAGGDPYSFIWRGCEIRR